MVDFVGGVRMSVFRETEGRQNSRLSVSSSSCNSRWDSMAGASIVLLTALLLEPRRHEEGKIVSQALASQSMETEPATQAEGTYYSKYVPNGDTVTVDNDVSMRIDSSKAYAPEPLSSTTSF